MGCKEWQQFAASLSPVAAARQEGILRSLRVTLLIQKDRIILAMDEVTALQQIAQHLLIAHHEGGLIKYPVEAHVPQLGVVPARGREALHYFQGGGQAASLVQLRVDIAVGTPAQCELQHVADQRSTTGTCHAPALPVVAALPDRTASCCQDNNNNQQQQQQHRQFVIQYSICNCPHGRNCNVLISIAGDTPPATLALCHAPRSPCPWLHACLSVCLWLISNTPAVNQCLPICQYIRDYIANVSLASSAAIWSPRTH